MVRTFLLFLLSWIFCQGWIPSKYLEKWYEPWEVCMFHSSNITEPKTLRDWCWERHGNGGHKPSFGECRIGGARWGRLCATSNLPFAERKYLTMSYREDLDDPAVKPLDKFGRLLNYLNGTVLPFGDSQMKGFEIGMNCEKTNKRASFSMIQLPKDYLQYSNFLSPSDSINYLSNVISNLFLSYNYIFFVINIGVHYNIESDRNHFHKNSQIDFIKNIPILLTWLNQLGSYKNITIAWMETLPQHYNTTNGYFHHHIKSSADSTLRCTPIINSSSKLDWRNDLIKQYIEQNRLYYINIIHTRNIFLPLHNEHYGDSGDCTHYCYSPMLYQPIFEQMLQILSKKVSKTTLQKLLIN